MQSVSPNPLRATVRILLLAVSALLIFGLTALVCAIPLLLFRNSTQVSAGIAMLGVLCGLIVWLFVAIFHIRRESLILQDNGRDTLLPQLRCELKELGYEAGNTHKGRTIFKPGFTAFLIGGNVQLTEQATGVVVTGPKVFIELLRKRLKILHHLTRVQQTIQDSRVRQGRNRLRRVEFDLRVSAAQWQQISDEVIAVLASETSDIVCEVHILAQNESGGLDTSVVTGIRERLRRQNIAVEIRKETRPLDVLMVEACVTLSGPLLGGLAGSARSTASGGSKTVLVRCHFRAVPCRNETHPRRSRVRSSAGDSHAVRRRGAVAVVCRDYHQRRTASRTTPGVESRLVAPDWR